MNLIIRKDMKWLYLPLLLFLLGCSWIHPRGEEVYPGIRLYEDCGVPGSFLLVMNVQSKANPTGWTPSSIVRVIPSTREVDVVTTVALPRTVNLTWRDTRLDDRLLYYVTRDCISLIHIFCSNLTALDFETGDFYQTEIPGHPFSILRVGDTVLISVDDKIICWEYKTGLKYTLEIPGGRKSDLYQCPFVNSEFPSCLFFTFIPRWNREMDDRGGVYSYNVDTRQLRRVYHRPEFITPEGKFIYLSGGPFWEVSEWESMSLKAKWPISPFVPLSEIPYVEEFDQWENRVIRKLKPNTATRRTGIVGLSDSGRYAILEEVTYHPLDYDFDSWRFFYAVDIQTGKKTPLASIRNCPDGGITSGPLIWMP